MHFSIDNPNLEKSLEQFAKETGQSINSLANNFLEQEIALYKNSPQHAVETLLRWKNYEETEESVSNEEVTKYVQSLRKDN